MENKFSIVMPVYNAEGYLLRSLSHVEALPQDEFEILFVDDGSIDQSASILVAYCNAHANAKFARLHKRIREENAERRAKGQKPIISDFDEAVMDVLNANYLI